MPNMSLGLPQKIEALQRARHGVRIALEAHTGATSASAKHLSELRAQVDRLARQADALIAMMRSGGAALSGQVSEAEDLRAFFRLAVGCIDARLDAVTGGAAPKARDPPQLRRVSISTGGLPRLARPDAKGESPSGASGWRPKPATERLASAYKGVPLNS